MVPQPSVTIIVLNWNSADRTIGCVKALQQLDYDNFRIRLVDNGSTDNSAEELARLKGIIFTRNAVNLGYTGGNNKAMQDAISDGAEYVWLVNNDAIVPRNCLSKLVSLAETAPEIGLVSPAIRENDDPIDPKKVFCGIPHAHYPQWELVTSSQDALAAQQDGNQHLILYGTALLIKRTLIEKIGFLDERLFAYCEDYDYCMRSMRGGFKNRVAIDACIFHAAVPDDERKPYYFYFVARNYLLVARKYLTVLHYCRYVWWRYRAARSLVSSLSSVKADAYLAGWWDGVRGRGGSFDPPRGIPAVIRSTLFPRSMRQGRSK
jgi:GT2 family glycosyltransferase